jgi:ribosome-associated toxin RatA of RatAB toxin-antitoxin module
MRELKRSAIVNRPTAEVFRLINDIARYPTFVPGCTRAEVLQSSEAEIVARLDVRRGPLHTHFTTRNRLQPPDTVHMELVEGPFRSLAGHWRLTPIGEHACRIELQLRFQFSNPLKAALLEPMLAATADQLVHAFVRRSQQAGV